MADDIVEKMQRIIASYNCTADQMCGDCPCKDTADRILSEILTPVRERLAEADEANQRVSDENAKLREALNEQIVSQQQLRSLIAQYSQRYVRMQEALKPFAYYAEQIPNDVSNTASASGTVGDLRAAKAALEEK